MLQRYKLCEDIIFLCLEESHVVAAIVATHLVHFNYVAEGQYNVYLQL